MIEILGFKFPGTVIESVLYGLIKFGFDFLFSLHLFILQFVLVILFLLKETGVS